jgi:hypothetical protein
MSLTESSKARESDAGSLLQDQAAVKDNDGSEGGVRHDEGERNAPEDESAVQKDEDDVKSVNDSDAGVVKSTEVNDGDAVDDSGGTQTRRPFVRSAAPSIESDESSDEETLFVSERRR